MLSRFTTLYLAHPLFMVRYLSSFIVFYHDNIILYLIVFHHISPLVIIFRFFLCYYFIILLILFLCESLRAIESCLSCASHNVRSSVCLTPLVCRCFNWWIKGYETAFLLYSYAADAVMTSVRWCQYDDVSMMTLIMLWWNHYTDYLYPLSTILCHHLSPSIPYPSPSSSPILILCHPHPPYPLSSSVICLQRHQPHPPAVCPWVPSVGSSPVWKSPKSPLDLSIRVTRHNRYPRWDQWRHQWRHRWRHRWR